MELDQKTSVPIRFGRLVVIKHFPLSDGFLNFAFAPSTYFRALNMIFSASTRLGLKEATEMGRDAYRHCYPLTVDCQFIADTVRKTMPKDMTIEIAMNELDCQYNGDRQIGVQWKKSKSSNVHTGPKKPQPKQRKK